jgi:hypothetical protein
MASVSGSFSENSENDESNSSMEEDIETDWKNTKPFW